MNITEALDLAIKQKETGTKEGVYEVCNNNSKIEKQTYMTNAQWKAFCDKMTVSAKNEYGKGGGSELAEKNGRPPKMASYGSSSRMIYNYSYKNPNFVFEKQLSTTVGGKANLDGFLDKGDRYVFVEAKCREPYSAKNNSVSTKYKPLYESINKEMQGSLQIDMKTSACGRYMNVNYHAGGEELVRFDLKQMICHLLAVATGALKGSFTENKRIDFTKNPKIDFIYFLYNPTKLPFDDDVAKEEIESIYNRTIFECNQIEWKHLFKVILEFLNSEHFKNVMSDAEIDNVVSNFEFKCVSQDDYEIIVK